MHLHYVNSFGGFYLLLFNLGDTLLDILFTLSLSSVATNKLILYRFWDGMDF